jgi:hypothetical protein
MEELTDNEQSRHEDELQRVKEEYERKLAEKEKTIEKQ